MPKHEGLPTSGYLLLDKREGVSSNGAVQELRRKFGIGGKRGMKAGHAGTLDPFATGLLLVLIGKATRLMPYIVGHQKRYLVDVQFGASSSTDDIAGELIWKNQAAPSSEVIADAVKKLSEQKEQIPPSVSAIHVNGKRAYARVLRGETLDLKPRSVNFVDINIIDIRAGENNYPVVRLDVVSSSGTYMRALARDLGELVGCSAFCSALRRLSVGEWNIDQAVTIEKASWSNVSDASALLEDMPRMIASEKQVDDLRSGRRIEVNSADKYTEGLEVCILDEGYRLIALAEVKANSALQPRSLFIDASGMAESTS